MQIPAPGTSSASSTVLVGPRSVAPSHASRSSLRPRSKPLLLGQQDGLDPGQALSESKSPTTPRYALQSGAVADTSSVHGPYGCHHRLMRHLSPHAHRERTQLLVSCGVARSARCASCAMTAPAPLPPSTSRRSTLERHAAREQPRAGGSTSSHAALPSRTKPKPTAPPSNDEFGGRFPEPAQRVHRLPQPPQRGVDGGQPTPTGWTTSAAGRELRGPGGQPATPGAAPTYTFLDGRLPRDRGVPAVPQVPLGLHDAAEQRGFQPTQYALDKGIEFNPNNLSFHPVEAPGTNTTRRWPTAWPGRRRTSCGTSPSGARSGA